MKEKFLEYSINRIRKKYPDYDEEKLEIIAYGLEALYITITKTIVIFSIALILGIIREVFLILVFYNMLRKAVTATSYLVYCLLVWLLYVNTSI